MPTPEDFLRQAIQLARDNVLQNAGGPFGALIVRDDQVISTGTNLVTSTNDPTAHAEVVAIRRACAQLKNFQLPGCSIYTSCEPCPMCLGAIYWSRPDHLYFAGTAADAAAAGFDDSFIYTQLKLHPNARSIKFHHMLRDEAQAAFRAWIDKPDKIPY